MEEASRRRVSAAKDDRLNPWKDSDLLTIRGEESWIAVDHRLHLLRSAYVFSRIIGSAISYVNDGITHVQVRRRETVGFSVAICQETMKAGKHYADFTLTQSGSIYIGIIRPIHDWPKKKMVLREFREYCGSQSGQGYEGNVHQYYFCVSDHSKFKKGDIAGMLLNLEEGTGTLYRNGVCLGVKVKNLAGHYCWAVAIKNDRDGRLTKYETNKPSMSIARGVVPGGS
eukprot:CAMPEP_0172542830 /NCGR_PEP_ID=MMETSP1067-20121228/13361_1 /TAXON_ID=265564 ORGANISM="Thalassiosira punctigera, Strain Tpunct2005C2" /NCGR_SAMPLE_ID=MMETSP1067 /ASSEMBLY_ACC=CAM_ASM_000444 /LENGTH=226 /DNA_ID=CAMNT_0013329133 /DNA_START=176 /DNA_END=856 /DNA_ORIENTATION=-